MVRQSRRRWVNIGESPSLCTTDGVVVSIVVGLRGDSRVARSACVDFTIAQPDSGRNLGEPPVAAASYLAVVAFEFYRAI